MLLTGVTCQEKICLSSVFLFDAEELRVLGAVCIFRTHRSCVTKTETDQNVDVDLQIKQFVSMESCPRRFNRRFTVNLMQEPSHPPSSQLVFYIKDQLESSFVALRCLYCGL